MDCEMIFTALERLPWPRLKKFAVINMAGSVFGAGSYQEPAATVVRFSALFRFEIAQCSLGGIVDAVAAALDALDSRQCRSFAVRRRLSPLSVSLIALTVPSRTLLRLFKGIPEVERVILRTFFISPCDHLS